MSCKSKGAKGSTTVSNSTPTTVTQTQENRTPDSSEISAFTPKDPVDVTTDHGDDDGGSDFDNSGSSCKPKETTEPVTVPTPIHATTAQESRTSDSSEISAFTPKDPVDVTKDHGDDDGGSAPKPTAPPYDIPPPHNPYYNTDYKPTKKYKPTKTTKKCKELDERGRQKQKQIRFSILNLRFKKLPLPKLAANLEKLEKERIQLTQKRAMVDSSADLPNDKKQQRIRTINQKLEDKSVKIEFFTKKIQKRRQKNDQRSTNTSSNANASDNTTSSAKHPSPKPTAPPNSPMPHNSPYLHPLYPVLEPVRLPSPPPPYVG